MNIIIISLIILFTSVTIFLLLGLIVSKHNLKKDKDDLLNYFKKNKDAISITINEDGLNTFTINPNKKYPLASTLKIIVAFNFVKYAINDRISITEKVNLDYLDRFYIENTDGGAHPRWKNSLNNLSEVSILEIAKGMMQFSSNACTDFLISKIGIDVINDSIEDLQLYNHDKITYLTPSVLIPSYLSGKKKLVANKISLMNLHDYQNLSCELFEKMANKKCDHLKDKAFKMSNQKIQLLTTKKLPHSTTTEYANLMFKLGNELLTEREKQLFSDILIGKSIKNEDDNFFWYKGGSTGFVLTSALYKQRKNRSQISVSLFIADDTGGELYWVRNILNNFVTSIANDSNFREKVKTL